MAKAKEEVKAHNYLVKDSPADGVRLIVRPNNTYAGAHAGECVIVDRSELANHSTMSACMTLKEADEIKRALAAEQAKQEERIRFGNPLKRAVDAGLAALLDTSVKQAKEKAKAETLESDKLARREAIRAEAASE